MGFRIVMIESDTRLSIKLDNLIVKKEEKETWIPIDDISMLVVDNLKIEMTTRMLCSFAKHNVGILFCDQEHLPIGFYSSYDNHSRVSKNIGYQINKDREFYDQLWKEIVLAKIQNQIGVLEILDKSVEKIEQLSGFCKEIAPGDVTNREAHAAKVYFNELMGTSFSRGNVDLVMNAGLDYGYSILRSYLARVCVAYGLNSQLGIHHCNEYNRFNLVDDLIEPFRPYVDLVTYHLLNGEKYLQIEHRHKLVNLLNHIVLYDEKKMYLCNVMETYVAKVASLICGKNSKIVYPDIRGYVGEEDEI